MIIRLHKAEDNSVLIIHDEDVLAYTTSEDNKTKIRFKDYHFDALLVNESVEKIYNMLLKQPTE